MVAHLLAWMAQGSIESELCSVMFCNGLVVISIGLLQALNGDKNFLRAENQGDGITNSSGLTKPLSVFISGIECIL